MLDINQICLVNINWICLVNINLFDKCLALLFGLCHLVSLRVSGLILQKICVLNIKADWSDCKKKSGNKAETKKLALISFLPQKVSRPLYFRRVSLNIFGLSYWTQNNLWGCLMCHSNVITLFIYSKKHVTWSNIAKKKFIRSIKYMCLFPCFVKTWENAN